MSSEDLKVIQQTLINSAQLMDGWHCDIAWTDDDTKVRQQVSDSLLIVEQEIKCKVPRDIPL